MIPTGIIIHHSFTRDGKVCDWAGIRKYHMSYRYQGNTITEAEYSRLSAKGIKGLEKPWSDIGYHAGVERINGVLTTQTGRPVNKFGAHCTGHNDMIGLCIVGNFDQAAPDDETLRHAAALTSGYLRTFGLTVNNVHRHHDYHPKSCPGLLFPWPRFLDMVREAL